GEVAGARIPTSREDREFLACASQLVVDCAGAIDDDRLEDWPGYFTEDCIYRVETREGRANGWLVGLVHCEGRAMLRDRVSALRHGNVYEAHNYRHIVSLARFAPASTQAAVDRPATGADVASARRVISSFNVTRVMKTGEMTLFAVGAFHDLMVEIEGRLLLHERAVVLDSRNLDTLLAIPI
ncbi:MAG: hypothetical protein H7125_00935, partial [Proteobacteria bacterium]|nr:hypothetical protein [Burkholderiales bacterium]